jgi:hypothetical protein
MQRGLSRRDRTWGIRTIVVRNQLVPVKRVPASSALDNENNEVAQVQSRIVGMWARCFPALGPEHCRLSVGRLPMAERLSPSLLFLVPESLVNIAHFQKNYELGL